MNKLFAQSLIFAANVYLEQKELKDGADYYMLENSKTLLDEAAHYGLVTWVNEIPMVNTKKMVGNIS